MPAYHFEGTCDSGLQVSGLLEADDESHARRKAQRFCGTSALVLLSEIELVRNESVSENTGDAGQAEGGCLSWKVRARRLAASIVNALRGV